MIDYAAKEYLHRRVKWMRYGVEIALVLAIWIGAYMLANHNDERMRQMEQMEAAQKLCFPVFPGEIASLAVTETGYECAIKHGHQVVARYAL